MMVIFVYCIIYNYKYEHYHKHYHNLIINIKNEYN